MIDTIKAWHFVGDTLRDGRPIPRNGSWLRHDGRIAICESGLHASRRPWHALQYAPGAVLCYVECRGDIHDHNDVPGLRFGACAILRGKRLRGRGVSSIAGMGNKKSRA